MRKEFPLCGNPRNPPFSKGEFRFYFSESSKNALLPLKKGGREGFWEKPFSMAKQSI
jgi:hypothetical protein